MPGGILALDPATFTGWAYSEPGGAPTWGSVRLGREGDGMGKVGAALWIFLEARLDALRPQYVVYEAPYVPRPSPGDKAKPINPETLRRLLGIAALIDTITEIRGIECRETTSFAFTKFFTGQGKFLGATAAQKTAAKKRAVVARCHMLGWKVTDNNQADALALLCYAETKLFPEMRLAMKRPAGPLFMTAS